ncbi:MAG: ParB/RepB/Spo0J family partition protein [Crocinitomicaceae bacterium]|nr:ParB/RepB/Spo0J family partition protein [Crocinitomicaceae bacterium]MCF8445061.1 ParB/RepB/Spo0J family partition protein [Crocinitomicaceae bacterium]
MSSNPKKRPALGKGLSALLENSNTDITSKSSHTGLVGSISMLAVSDIEANPFNPRTHFEKEALMELAESITTHGIIQPLTVRKMGRDKYQLISGERRFRACQIAGITEVPAYVRVANDQAMLEMALVENIQRENLNAIEIALSYDRLIQECSLTQEQLSQKLAKSRSGIANFLRLLKLPASIQAGVRDGKISMGHARALLSSENEAEMLEKYKHILDANLSVREVETLTKNSSKSPVFQPVEKIALTKNQAVFKDFLSDRLSTKVNIVKSKSGSGKISLNFSSEAELNRIIQTLKG